MSSLSPLPSPRPRPRETFPTWTAGLRLGQALAREPEPDLHLLRTSAHLEAPIAQAVASWFTNAGGAPTERVRAAYGALERETERLFHAVVGRLGVRVVHVHHEPYASAAELCADLRRYRRMQLRTSDCDPPHLLLDSSEGGTLDQLRVVHDVLGHAALGVGFDLDAEYAAWLQCRVLFGPDARRAAFTELLGAVTAYVSTGHRPGRAHGTACGDRVQGPDGREPSSRTRGFGVSWTT